MHLFIRTGCRDIFAGGRGHRGQIKLREQSAQHVLGAFMQKLTDPNLQHQWFARVASAFRLVPDVL
jgi:hypothetical protein